MDADTYQNIVNDPSLDNQYIIYMTYAFSILYKPQPNANNTIRLYSVQDANLLFGVNLRSCTSVLMNQEDPSLYLARGMGSESFGQHK